MQEQTRVQAQPSQSILADVKALMDSLDPAHRRAIFLGFPEGMDASTRTERMKTYMNHFPAFSNHCGIGAIYQGPKTNGYYHRHVTWNFLQAIWCANFWKWPKESNLILTGRLSRLKKR